MFAEEILLHACVFFLSTFLKTSALDGCFACVGLLGVRVRGTFWRYCDIGVMWGMAWVRLPHLCLSFENLFDLTWYRHSCTIDNAVVWWGNTMTVKLLKQLPEDLLQSFRKQRLRNRSIAKLQWNYNKHSWLWLRVKFSSYYLILQLCKSVLLCIFKCAFFCSFVLKPHILV